MMSSQTDVGLASQILSSFPSSEAWLLFLLAEPEKHQLDQKRQRWSVSLSRLALPDLPSSWVSLGSAPASSCHFLSIHLLSCVRWAGIGLFFALHSPGPSSDLYFYLSQVLFLSEHTLHAALSGPDFLTEFWFTQALWKKQTGQEMGCSGGVYVFQF